MDAIEQAVMLEGFKNYVEDGSLVELRPCGFVSELNDAIALLHEGGSVPYPDVAVVTRDDDNSIVTVLFLSGGGYNSVAAHRAVKAIYGIPEDVHLHSRMIGTEPVPTDD